VGLNSLKSPNLTNGYPNNKNKNNKVKSKPYELFELAGKKIKFISSSHIFNNFADKLMGKLVAYLDKGYVCFPTHHTVSLLYCHTIHIIISTLLIRSQV
jgi:hypothetical protein